MVIWRSLSPSVLARVLEMAAAEPVRRPTAPNQRRVSDTTGTASTSPGTELDNIAGAKSLPGE